MRSVLARSVCVRKIVPIVMAVGKMKSVRNAVKKKDMIAVTIIANITGNTDMEVAVKGIVK